MALDLAAGPNAAPAEDTPIEIHPDERVRVVDRKPSPSSSEAGPGKMMALCERMQLAPASLLMGEAIDRMIAQQQLDRKPPGLDRLFSFGPNLHAFRRRDGASGPQIDGPVLGHLYQADATARLRWKRWDLTEGGDGDPLRSRSIEESDPLRDHGMTAVDCQRYGRGAFHTMLLHQRGETYSLENRSPGNAREQ